MPQNSINEISNHNNLFYRRIRNKYIGFDIDSKKTVCSILDKAKPLWRGRPDVYNAKNDELFPTQLFFLLTTYNPS